MKLKYYLRGLGTGVAVTALIIGISGGVAGKRTMTDEEVKIRAKELGMVERSVLSEMENASKENPSEESRVAETSKENNLSESKQPEERHNEEKTSEESEEESEEEIAPVETQQEQQQETVGEETVQETEVEEETSISKESSGNADTQNKEDNPANEEPVKKTEIEMNFGMPDEVGTINIQIVRGDSSDSVSRRLAEAGLVDNAINYDSFLCRNGYDKRIQTGNYEIPANATEEEIARMITSR